MNAKDRWEKAEEQRKESAGVANGAQPSPSPDGVPGAAAAAAKGAPKHRGLAPHRFHAVKQQDAEEGLQDRWC